MKRMIGYCGYNCHLCAARSDDPDLRQKMVDGWRKFFGHQNYTAENVRCDGCLNSGRIADKECQARPCAIKKGVSNCVYCDEFPCDKVKKLFGTREGMLVFCYPGSKDITEQEYNLCMRQFNSLPNILKMLADAGKIPPWVKECYRAKEEKPEKRE